MAIVYIGLGSNLGDRLNFIHQALEQLAGSPSMKVVKVSSIIETDPVGGPVQGKFLNAVAECQTDLTAEELLKHLQGIEVKLGRVRIVKDGPRVIDLDILLYDQIVINLPHLIIPHPRMTARDFVLRPLKEIAPHLTIVKDYENS